MTRLPACIGVAGHDLLLDHLGMSDPLLRRALHLRTVVVVATLMAATLLLTSTSYAVRAQDAQDATMISPRELVPLLTRSGVGPDWTIIDVTYAPPVFFEATGIPLPVEMEGQPTLAFMLQESVHDGELPLEAPAAFLLLPDGERAAPYDARITADDIHHRTSRLLFGQPMDWPPAPEDERGVSVLRLVVPDDDGSYSLASTFEWVVPVEVGIQIATDEP